MTERDGGRLDSVVCTVELPAGAFPLPGGGFGFVPDVELPAQAEGQLSDQFVGIGYVDESRPT